MRQTDDGGAAAVVEGIRQDGGVATGLPGDVTDYAAVEQVRRHAEQRLGPVDVLVAFAGGGKADPVCCTRPARKTGTPLWMAA